MVSTDIGLFRLFLICSVILIEKTSSQVTCTFYKYKSTLYYDDYGYAKYRKLYDTTKYCTSSCCTDDCCSDYTYSYSYYYYYYYDNASISASTIAGIVTGSLIGLGILISIVVACCICCKRRQSQPGLQVVFTSGQNANFIHTSQTSAPGQAAIGGTYPQHLYDVQPQGYIYPGVGSSTPTVSGNPSTSNAGFRPDRMARPPQRTSRP